MQRLLIRYGEINSEQLAYTNKQLLNKMMLHRTNFENDPSFTDSEHRRTKPTVFLKLFEREIHKKEMIHCLMM